MGEIEVDLYGEIPEELEDAMEVVLNYIDVEGFEWVRNRLESMEEVTYIEGVALEIKEEIEVQDELAEPFTAGDEKDLKLTYEMEIGMARLSGEDVEKVKREFLMLDEDEDEYEEDDEDEDEDVYGCVI